MLYVTSYHILLLYVIFLIIPRAQGFRVSSLRSVSSMMRVSSVDSNSIKQDAFTLENQSVYCQLVNIFGRLAEQKALGYTSSYKTYVPTPLSLWLPNRWSRRLRVDDPDWKLIFQNESAITKDQFISRLKDRPFKYPSECKIPEEVANHLNNFEITETSLRANSDLLRTVENVFAINYRPEKSILDVVYYLFGGREELNVEVMESRVLEWGRLACPDDPVIDWPIFESQCQAYLKRTDLQI